MTTRTKYFRAREPALSEFELLCKARKLVEGEIISDLIETFLRENRSQATLPSFPHERTRELSAVFDRASVMLAQSELERILALLEANRDDEERRHTFQLDLARALKVVEPVYHRTHDVKLAKLLTEAEAKLA